MKLEIKDNNLQELFIKAGRQLPYITMLALNNTAFDAQKALKAEVNSKLDLKNKKLPNAFRVKKASKQNLTAQVFVDEFSWQGEALAPHFYGGDRERKGMEKALIYMGAMSKSQILTPSGGIKIRPSLYVEMMSYLKLNYKAGYSANRTKRSSKRKRKNTTKYFIATKGDKRTKHLAEGVYATRDGYDYPLSILTISDKPTYKKIFDLDTIVHKVIKNKFDGYFIAAFDRAMRTAR